jgi:hypothetical protein
VNLFGHPDKWWPYVTFKNATIAVVGLFLVTNVLWFALGWPYAYARPGIPGAPALTPAPMLILCDIAVVAILLVVAYRLGVRSRYYRIAVIIYAMLLANLIAATRSYLLLRIGL